MAMTYAKKGDLRKHINSNYNKLTWDDKLSHLYWILNSLTKIHEEEIVHRDFHPGNILFLSNLIIADFGLSGPANLKKSSKEIYGVLPYMSPEVLNGKPYTQAADVYSFGMIMYEIVTGERPFAGRSHDIQLVLDIYKGKRPELPIHLPAWCKFLLEKCWLNIPENRPSAKELEDFIFSIMLPDISWETNALHSQYYNTSSDEEIKEYVK